MSAEPAFIWLTSGSRPLLVNANDIALVQKFTTHDYTCIYVGGVGKDNLVLVDETLEQIAALVGRWIWKPLP